MTGTIEKNIKRSFRIDVIIDGAKKEFAEGMGVGVIGSQVVTFDLPQSKYDSPMFAMSLSDYADRVRDDLVRTVFVEVENESENDTSGG